MENNVASMSIDTNILIIGAGIAGLSAASHLAQNGCKEFKILEARKRIGGRIIAINVGKEKAELGANWIHGVLGNPMFELAMANGLVDILQVPKPHRVVAATEDGKQIPFKILQEIYEAYMCFLKRCEEYFLCQYSPPNGIHSVGDHIKLEINLYLDRFPNVTDRYLRQLIFDCLLKRESCISGCDSMSEIDLLELGSYTELQGGNIVLPTGYSSILNPIMKEIPNECLLVDHAVKRIKWCLKEPSEEDDGQDSDDSDRTVIDAVPTTSNTESEFTNSSSSTKPQRTIEVLCENGVNFYADHLICTLPLGVLKDKSDSMFSPKLPDYKVEAIDRLLFGTVDKILLEYERPFLNPNITEVMLLWETEVAKSEAEPDISQVWFKKIYSFSKVTDTLLLGWISGKEAEYMETLSMDVVGEKCTEILRKFLNDPFIPKPTTCVCTSWATQPYTKGSYTAIAVGASQIDIEYLAQPIYSDANQQKPILLFAGEHTHSNFYSTVHGAYLTGRTAAQILLTPDTPKEIVMNCEDTNDLSSWIQGINLE